MKRIAPALSGLFLIGLAACNNDAASKIDNKDTAEQNAAQAEQNNAQAGQRNDMTAVNDADDGAKAEFSFEKESHDFGNIEEGAKAEYTFSFTNTGDAPLIISNAKGSCGCTVPQWPREPIAPGETGEIEVIFDSSGKPGRQTKQVTLNANTIPNQKVLTISAQVQPKPGQEGATQQPANS